MIARVLKLFTKCKFCLKKKSKYNQVLCVLHKSGQIVQGCSICVKLYLNNKSCTTAMYELEMKKENWFEKRSWLLSLNELVITSEKARKRYKKTLCPENWPLSSLFDHALSLTDTQHIHWYAWAGGVADVGTFVLWDKSCFIGTDYCFILSLQTQANISLHTNGLTPTRER